MSATDTALAADWLGACRRAVAGMEGVLSRASGVEARAA
jgi:hypothetical protein